MSTDNTNLGPKTALIPMNERGIILASLEDAYRFANAVVSSGLAPKHFDTAEKVIVAMQWGSEIGLSKMQSLQNIAVVNGRACLWGDALPALVWASGKCSDIKERFENQDEGDKFKAVCEVHRIGKASPTICEYSIADAKKAKLWDRAGPWQQHPKRMLQMRARAFAFRDTFADVLCGMAIAEEAQDMPAVNGEQLPALTDASKAMLAATLDGKCKCSTDGERSAVCRYVAPLCDEWDAIDNAAAKQILLNLNEHTTRKDSPVPWNQIKERAMETALAQ